jgi:hypothetical protein
MHYICLIKDLIKKVKKKISKFFVMEMAAINCKQVLLSASHHNALQNSIFFSTDYKLFK